HDLEDLEVSYLFLPEHWGRGYARAAVKQALAYAFGTIGLRRVLAETQSANGASVRLLEHLGFCLVGNVNRFGAEQSIYRAEPSSLQAAT
ncbi:GNAT family N-acetyltransferase, partial [Ideonella sp. DXS29W]